MYELFKRKTQKKGWTTVTIPKLETCYILLALYPQGQSYSRECQPVWRFQLDRIHCRV